MKLTTKKLTQIIREEVENTLIEAEPGDLGTSKPRRKYMSRDISDVYVKTPEGKSVIELKEVIPELEAQNLGIAKTRKGWKAIDFAGTEEEMREKMASDADFASLIQRLADARQIIISRGASTTSRTEYPFRVRGEQNGKLYVKLFKKGDGADGEIAEIAI